MDEHAHDWREVPAASTSTVRRFYCECGANGYSQVGVKPAGRDRNGRALRAISLGWPMRVYKTTKAAVERAKTDSENKVRLGHNLAVTDGTKRSFDASEIPDEDA